MIYAASDLHGQWDKYQELVKRLALNDGENELYLLGDLIDRGPGSCKILLDIKKRDNIHALFGNHEYMAAMCLSWVLKEITKDSIDDLTELQMATLDEWILNGGGATMAELHKLTAKEKRAVFNCICNMDLYAEVETSGCSFLLTHAGLNHFEARKDICEYQLRDFIFGRSFLEQEFYPDRYLVFGHTPTREIHKMLGEPPTDDIIFHKSKIAIDCGCCYDGGRLGCLNLDTLETFYI